MKLSFEMPPDLWSGNACAMMVVAFTGFHKGLVESALVWLSRSRECLGLAADVATLFGLTKSCGGEPMVKFNNNQTPRLVQGITHLLYFLR